MKDKNVKFAKELCFNAILEDAESLLKIGCVEYQVTKDDLLIRVSKDRFSQVKIVSEETFILSELLTSYGRTLLRIDMLDEEYITFTVLEFSDSVIYDNDNPFRIVVDQALAADLRSFNITAERAIKEIRKQIIIKGDMNYCFSYARGNDTRDLEIIGEQYTFVITETPQHYLHITQMRRRTNKSRIDFPVVLIKGTIEVVDELTDRAMLTKRADEQYSKLVSSDTEFIELWNIYNELELESIKQQAQEMGYLKYKSFRYANGSIVFSLDGGYTRREFCVDNMYYVAIANINPEAPMDYNYRMATIIGTEINYNCINASEFCIKEDMDTTRVIPSKGYLLPSVSGSAVQSKRRKQAQLSILSNKCQLPGLKNIIQGGAQVGAIGRHVQPVSYNLEKEIFGKKEMHFTEKQKKALNAAINTPDIAIIQGPPGTGKTTIIKGIVKRIDELWESKAKILITSTQHDAVDNAVEEINYGGVPVNRVAIRKGKDAENWLIYDWIDNMVDSCENWIEQNGGTERSIIRNIFEKLIQVEENKEFKDKYNYLNQVFDLIQSLNIKQETNSCLLKVLSELGVKCSADIYEEDTQLHDLIRGQRLNKEAYLDDGIAQLKQLERYLKFDSNIEFEIPSFWSKLKRITKDCPELETYLLTLQKNCDTLEELCLCGDSVNDELLLKDIQDLVEDIRMELVSRGEDNSTLLGNLIWEFKQQLTNTNNVERLIKAYSKINAATCQQAANPFLSKSMNGFNEVYDYVIVDEAARSNPLDLLIPMAMGKKIILVGDHKQLPHMVERDIVQAVSNKSLGKNVESVLEESLFMRLNESVSKEDKKNGVIRTAMLNEQYRMHPDICELVNVFYDGKLETMCKAEDKAHNLNLYNNKAVVWIDLPLSDKFPAEIKRQSVSRKCEVDKIQEELSKILVQNTDYTIGLITFYSAQAQLLNDMVQTTFPGEVYRIQVGTVDAFQGKEFDIVLLSVVRANEESDMRRRVGFLDNANRLCVAFSRAKRLLIAVGDTRTVAWDGKKEYVKALHEMYKKSQ